MLSLPGDPFVVPDREEQIELLGEQLVVVAQVVTEQAERHDERASPRHDLGSTVRDQVDVRELLEDPDRVVGGEHTHGAREPDLLRDGGDRGQRSRRRRNEVVGTVMLADGEHLQAELVRQPGFLQEVAHAFRGTETGVEGGEGD